MILENCFWVFLSERFGEWGMDWSGVRVEVNKKVKWKRMNRIFWLIFLRF